MSTQTKNESERIPQCLSAHEMSERLGVTRRHLYRLADRDAIPHYRVGRRVVFPERAVQEFLAGQAERTT